VNDFDKFAEDRSAGVDFTITVVSRNGPLSPDERLALLHAVRNAARMVRAQVYLVAPDHTEVKLKRQSSRTGTAVIELEGGDDD
jgi:hypothetical protein